MKSMSFHCNDVCASRRSSTTSNDEISCIPPCKDLHCHLKYSSTNKCDAATVIHSFSVGLHVSFAHAGSSDPKKRERERERMKTKEDKSDSSATL